jgi:hypothetical protein
VREAVDPDGAQRVKGGTVQFEAVVDPTCQQGDQHGSLRAGGPVGYGPNLAAFAVYLMVVHFLPAHRGAAYVSASRRRSPGAEQCRGGQAARTALRSAV